MNSYLWQLKKYAKEMFEQTSCVLFLKYLDDLEKVNTTVAFISGESDQK